MVPIRKLLAGFIISTIGLSAYSAKAAEDNRELVELPKMMQEHMLANMPGHLVALSEIFGELAKGRTDKAVIIAEEQLGMSSLSLHGAEHLGKFMPKSMGKIGAQMHHAASRFVIAAQDAELNPGKNSQQKVYEALQEITDNCNACHMAYRIR